MLQNSWRFSDVFYFYFEQLRKQVYRVIFFY